MVQLAKDIKSGAGHKTNRLDFAADTLAPAKLPVVRPAPYLGPLVEKNPWFLSLCLAVALHAALLAAGKVFFVKPAEYGLQGSMASMEVTMIAAPAEPVKKNQVPPPVKQPALRPALIEPVVKAEEKKPEPKPAVKGDGSSPAPGKNNTTFTARASSETQARSGKYRNAPPQYPVLAERNGWEGTVMLKALVEKEGRASQVVVGESSGYKILDKAALKAVQKWQFEPGRIGSVTVASWVKIPVRFRIEKNL